MYFSLFRIFLFSFLWNFERKFLFHPLHRRKHPALQCTFCTQHLRARVGGNQHTTGKRVGLAWCLLFGKYGIMLVQDLIVNSLWLMSLVTAGSDLSLTLGYSLGTHCSIVRYDCFEFLRYACFATLPSHCIHYITLGLHCIPWIVLAVYPFILSIQSTGRGDPTDE